jgi:carbamoyl-phosphate synthase large subunit
MAMKALLIAAGRRVSLAKRFIAAGFDVFSYETEASPPISEVATIIKGQPWGTSLISNTVVECHIQNTIDEVKPNLVLPLADKATDILAELKWMHKGIVVGCPDGAYTCLNKRAFERVLHSKPYYPNPAPFHQVILKPIEGFGSKGLQECNYYDYQLNKDEYEHDYVAQRLIEGFEISVDAYFNKDNKMVDAVPRKRIEIQGGEVCRSITMERNVFGVSDITREIGHQIGLVGPICAQFIIEDSKPYIMEINARFGGGVVLSMEAGFDMIDLLKREYVDGETIKPKEYPWKVGVGMVRYFQEHFTGDIDTAKENDNG